MRSKILFLGAFATLLAAAGFGVNAAKAVNPAIITPASANVSADSATGASVTLPAMVITEGDIANISAGTFVWVLPAGFVFDTTSVPNVAYTGASLAGSATASFPTSTTMSVTVSAVSTAAGSMTIGSTTPLKVRAAAGTPLASGNILLTSGTIQGITSSTNFGTLTEVPGAANKLAFSVQPPATVTVSAIFSASAAVKDQFGNTLTSDNGRAITLAAVLSSNTSTPGTGVLGGTLTVNNTSGVSAFPSLTYSAAESIKLNATAAGIGSVLSNAIAVSALATPPSTACDLRNGILVKVQGSPTVYMVVNCTLRPFNSAAIFHARGKKFEDIEDLDYNKFLRLLLGKPVGQSDDDNIPSPAPAPLTGESSSLPEGAIVKVPNDPTVYMVVSGKLQPFASLAVFQARRKRFQDIRILMQDQFSKLTVDPTPVPFPDNTLIKGSGNTVFVIRNGEKIGITSLKVLSKRGLSLKELIKIDDHEIDRLKDGGIEDDEEDD